MVANPADPHQGTKAGLQDPPFRLRAITPNDSADLDLYVRGIYVGTGGDLKVLAVSDEDPVTLVGVPGGTYIPMRVKRVYATGTDAEDLVGMV